MAPLVGTSRGKQQATHLPLAARLNHPLGRHESKGPSSLRLELSCLSSSAQSSPKSHHGQGGRLASSMSEPRLSVSSSKPRRSLLEDPHCGTGGKLLKGWGSHSCHSSKRDMSPQGRFALTGMSAAHLSSKAFFLGTGAANSEAVRLVIAHLKPLRHSLETRYPAELEAAVRDACSQRYLKTVARLRRCKHDTHSQKSACEISLASQLVKARTLLKKWQLALHDMDIARRERDAVRLWSLLDTWKFDFRERQVNAAREDLLKWADVYEEHSPKARPGTPLDLNSLKELHRNGPRVMPGLDEALENYRQFRAQEKALEAAIAHRDGGELEQATEGWDFQASHPAFREAAVLRNEFRVVSHELEGLLERCKSPHEDAASYSELRSVLVTWPFAETALTKLARSKLGEVNEFELTALAVEDEVWEGQHSPSSNRSEGQGSAPTSSPSHGSRSGAGTGNGSPEAVEEFASTQETYQGDEDETEEAYSSVCREAEEKGAAGRDVTLHIMDHRVSVDEGSSGSSSQAFQSHDSNASVHSSTFQKGLQWDRTSTKDCASVGSTAKLPSSFDPVLPPKQVNQDSVVEGLPSPSSVGTYTFSSAPSENDLIPNIMDRLLHQASMPAESDAMQTQCSDVKQSCQLIEQCLGDLFARDLALTNPAMVGPRVASATSATESLQSSHQDSFPGQNNGQLSSYLRELLLPVPSVTISKHSDSHAA